MSWKYELTVEGKTEFPIPGTGELVTLKKGKSVEIDQFIADLPPGVKVTEVKPKKSEAKADDDDEDNEEEVG